VSASATDRELQHRLLAATAIVREAGAVARRAFLAMPAFSAANLKGAQDYFTEVDGQVEKLIRSRFADAFPADNFFGEEGGGSTEGDLWLVDPIDGTANFARGMPAWCISIAFIRDGAAEIGVIHDPNMDELFACRRGGGASLDGKPIAVSGVADLRQATLEIGWSSRLPHAPYLAAVARALEAGANVRRSGSGALALAYVAAGRLEGYAELHMNAWDAVAGQLLVREAGGRTNDFLGEGGLRRGNVVLAANARLFDQLNLIVRPTE
jgi:myo-inositol-1(or 4)-monophosphatase